MKEYQSLSHILAKAEGNEVRFFLMRDGASCSKDGQKVPESCLTLGLAV